MGTHVREARDVLAIDAERETERIVEAIRQVVFYQFKRKGAVVGVSGGIDSSVVAALCARALGPDRVLGLLMPEGESSPDSVVLGRQLAESLGIRSEMVDITPMLDASRCYRRRDDAIRLVVPEYGAGWKCKITLPDLIAADQIALFSVVVQSPAGERRKVRLTLEAYLGMVAASNMKQRTRKMVEYYHADRLNFAVAGTPNRLEYELGFFVKCGDGAADFKPIAHLYKTQVYQLAEYLEIPKEIQERPPTTDTYPLEQSQEEFYFSMPLSKMDVCLYGRDHGTAASELAPMVELTADQVQRAYSMIDRKRAHARYLHRSPVCFGETSS
ncbi:NAD(+) synthase [Occallatibacter savannae]|uniref:NAD(+) synthase n=1 Tax=Occallatibacter savannae TaxID=1002691 RepID=UPI000D690D52|nr:NAD(+) synthase [Occallatibacter savannae]